MRHDDGEALNLRGRVEFLTDDSDEGHGQHGPADGLARYELSNEARIVADLDAMFNDTASESLPEGNYVDLSLGYAFRPILDDRLNVLAMYQYVDDMVGQEDRRRGNSHRCSAAMSSVWMPNTTFRRAGPWAERSAAAGRQRAGRGSAFTLERCLLAVANARYRLVHDWDVLLEGTQPDHDPIWHIGLRRAGRRLHAGGRTRDDRRLLQLRRVSDDLTDLVQDDHGGRDQPDREVLGQDRSFFWLA